MKITSVNLKYDKKRNKFLLNLSVEREFENIETADFYIGVDLVLRKLAVVSTPDGKINKFFDSGHIRAVSKGTAFEKRHLKIAKEIVKLVPAGGMKVNK